ncbi:uncharacterized protein Dana_GF23037 [Drosophila ananassae]|uniref:C2H2-type domain-containing protein n=1 Tax=Drosophila ananassae TaxID=7217 RepID=B3MTX7_DROAN|nr:uncharacterized protein LOC6505683 [Drosophila ananassae]EDV30258.1 uncharacterized protein Dana_GF23037 [Drosophila ananassae]
MDESCRSTVGKSDSRRSSIAANDESVTMYLSFDADDTLSSGTSTKWQSAVVTQSSQFLEIHNSKMEANVEETVLRRSVLKDLQQIITGEQDQGSPLRPFNMSILNKHNALSSTPSKDTPVITNLDVTNVENKENSHTGENDHSTLSSSVDVSVSTVKANTLKTIDGTIDEESVQEIPKPSVSNVYPLSANVVLENITEVSNEGVSMVASPPPEKHDPQVEEVVNEVSELISKALKISAESVKPQPPKIKVEGSKKRMTIAVGSSGGMPRPRRSYLPTSSVESRTYSFKQRMSVVVKTTLNSPARKLSAGGSLAVGRRSCLPVAKPKLGTKSVAVSSSRTPQNIPTKVIKQTPKTTLPVIYNCKTCDATFRVKSLLDMHVRMHDMVENGPKSLKRLNTNTVGGGTSALGSKNSCKYCDKNFALERALHIHLMQNCSKIPPGEKRKLQFTELNHEKKAQLPKIGASNAVNQPCTLSQKTQQRFSMIPSKATSSFEPPMAPPSTKKVPKKAAHAGVYRTPTKTVPCHICKQSFKSILEFTNHSLTVHTKNFTQKPPAGRENAPSAQD